jgi:ADP-ribose pyrophosphatase
LSAEKEPQLLYGGEFLRLMRRGHWDYVERTNSWAVAIIVAVTPGDKLLLVEQFRLPVNRSVIELPAGLVGDAGADEPLVEAARRELLEETGYAAAQIEILASGPVTAGLSNEVSYFCAARGLVREGPGGGDDSEDIRVHEVLLADLPAWLARAGKNAAIDPKIYAGLWLLRSNIQ